MALRFESALQILERSSDLPQDVSFGLAICAALLIGDTAHFAARSATVRPLLEAVEDRPEDVDARIKLAHHLAWEAQYKASRKHAERVLELAPDYLDARILIARLDAWEGDFESARAGLRELWTENPDDTQLLLMLADVEVWSGNLGEARLLLEGLVSHKPNADTHARLARVHRLSHQNWSAYRHAGQALTLDPDHEMAASVMADTTLLTATAMYELETLPNGTVGHAEIVEVAALRNSTFSWSILHEYRYRNLRHNNTVGGGLQFRLTEDLRLSASLRYGVPSPSVPFLSGRADAALRLGDIYEVGVRYMFDYWAYRSELHRGIASASVDLPNDFNVGVAYSAGAVRGSGAGFVHAVWMRAGWFYKGHRINAHYRYGGELLRNAPVTSLLRPTSHGFGAQGFFALGRHVALRAGYGVTLGTAYRPTQVMTAGVQLSL